MNNDSMRYTSGLVSSQYAVDIKPISHSGTFMSSSHGPPVPEGRNEIMAGQTLSAGHYICCPLNPGCRPTETSRDR